MVAGNRSRGGFSGNIPHPFRVELSIIDSFLFFIHNALSLYFHILGGNDEK
jgi:hypothetical protein